MAKHLKNGESIRIGGNAKVWTTVERSCDGKVIRYVRHTPTGFVVFRTEYCDA